MIFLNCSFFTTEEFLLFRFLNSTLAMQCVYESNYGIMKSHRVVTFDMRHMREFNQIFIETTRKII